MPGTREVRTWIPVALLGAGCALLLLAKQQEVVPLAAPAAAAVPQTILARPSWDVPISPQEQQIAGMSDYVLRAFGADSARYDFSVYFGYYEEQTQGRSIHSPKNCLPGAGWEAVSAEARLIETDLGAFTVNRYVLANRSARAVVYYWYQGRGRIAWNEYAVKWDLLRDKAVHGRSEEALVRIVVPVREDEAAADSLATGAAQVLIPSIFGALPGFPGRTPGAIPAETAFITAASSPHPGVGLLPHRD